MGLTRDQRRAVLAWRQARTAMAQASTREHRTALTNAEAGARRAIAGTKRTTPPKVRAG